MYQTLAQRKIKEAERRTDVVRHLSQTLAAFARSKGGRYFLYGSAARDGMRYDSDIDLLVDFPPDTQPEAWRLAETMCVENGLEFDIMPLAWCDPCFVVKVVPTSRILG